ncbi:hypothetical protein MNBD_GAMMA08-136 [hydrothermal vent metagenome]|uniref:Uncharacterized protein n=1 Tax=hydrothermal vent metagenome TaxID=652676 RepID=A0A3B0X3W3_9ZZZZ
MNLKLTQYLIGGILLCCMSSAPFSIANAYDFSSGVFDFQKKLAKKGDPQAQYKLANMYENGQGVKVDLNAAVEWYKKSAAQNYSAAKMRLTYVDIKTNGYQKTKHETWLKKLQSDAANNDGESLFLLATMHKTGSVVKKDLNKSASLFKRATNKNIPGAEAEYEAVNALLYDEKAETRKANQQKKTQADIAKKEKAKQDKLTLEKKRAAEKRKKSLAAQQAASRDRSNTEKKRKARERDIAAQKKRSAEESNRLKEEQRALHAEKKAAEEAQNKAKKEEKPLVDKSMCKGKKARFLTTCR